MNFLFGPVNSRRLGRSLGIDLFREKICNLNCVYCEVGPTTARVLPGHTLKWREAWAAPAGGLIITASWNVGGPVSFM